MTATSLLRTPGLYFEAHAPDPRDVLPRLDIAAFVGFAASGPLDVPVPIEDAARFEEVFGRDLKLGIAGQELRTQLAPAVRAFFRNGGRRCWVVRVARTPIANEFVLPGMIRVNRLASHSAWSPAIARARSEGSWSDAIGVNTTLSVAPLPRGSVEIRPRQIFSLALQTGRTTVHAGELLRIDVKDSALTAFVAVAADPVPDAGGRIELRWHDAVWLEEANAEPWRFAPAEIVRAWHVVASGVRHELHIVDAVRDEGALRAVVVSAGATLLREGSWIELDVATTASPAERVLWLLQVEHTRPAGAIGSPRAEGTGLEIEARRAWRFVDPPSSLAPDAIQVNALTFALWTRDETGRSARLDDLGFSKGHARYWGGLPTDTELFSLQQLALAEERALARDVSHPRFPLAGPAPPRSDELAVMYLPVGIPAALAIELEQRALPRREPRAVRDGCARIDAGLFLDPALAATSADDLIEHAFRVLYADAGRSGRRLSGLHSLTYLDEISLVAAPDALLGGLFDVRSIPPPPAITLTAAGDHVVSLEWPSVPEAVAYTLQQSETADFQAPSSERLVPGESSVLVTDDPIGRSRRQVDRPRGACASTHWYRVRVEALSGGGPWSNTVGVRAVSATFASCVQVGEEAPALAVTPTPGQITFTWTNTGAAHYRLECATEPTFATAQVLVDGASTSFSMVTPAVATYVRVRAQTTPPGAWSNSVRIDSDPDTALRLPAADAQVQIARNTARDVNAALLRFCAARGDVFAILGAPAAVTADDVIAHKSDIVAASLAREDRRTPSFGALYHPWLVVTEPSDAVTRPVAPSGTICGLIAARTLAHGAWFAPANQRLAGVVSTLRAVDRPSWAALNASNVNAVTLQPHGFVTLSAHTLTPDDDVREISVRRLLMLLRRLAQREGSVLVFEPNGPDLRRAVRRQFERVLGDLFMRGALAGRTRSDAFQVVVDDTNNPPQSVDIGRLVVELRVAPSKPLEFLTVRFVLRGGGSTSVEGA